MPLQPAVDGGAVSGGVVLLADPSAVLSVQAAGLRVWLDQEVMDHDLDNQMSDGIDQSLMVGVFVTRAYLEKVGGLGAKGLDDNCQREFGYAVRRRGAVNMVPIVMERACCDTTKWSGALGFTLGGQLFHDFSRDGLGGKPDAAKIEALAATIRKRTQELAAKSS